MREISEAQTAPTGNSEKTGLIPGFLAPRPYFYYIKSLFIEIQRELWVVKPHHTCPLYLLKWTCVFFLPSIPSLGIT